MNCTNCFNHPVICKCNGNFEKAQILQRELAQRQRELGEYIIYLKGFGLVDFSDFPEPLIEVCGNSPFVTPLHGYVVAQMESNYTWNAVKANIALFDSVHRRAKRVAVFKNSQSLLRKVNANPKARRKPKPFVDNMFYRNKGETDDKI
tara:strand:+ start:5438 stop:5881 length:444 start_codon:yes stop_codon:yes gene_type:complete